MIGNQFLEVPLIIINLLFFKFVLYFIIIAKGAVKAAPAAILCHRAEWGFL